MCAQERLAGGTRGNLFPSLYLYRSKMFFNCWGREYTCLQKVKPSYNVRQKAISWKATAMRLGGRSLPLSTLPHPHPPASRHSAGGTGGLGAPEGADLNPGSCTPSHKTTAHTLAWGTSSWSTPGPGRRRAWSFQPAPGPLPKGLKRESSPHVVSWLGWSPGWDGLQAGREFPGWPGH